MTGRRDQAATVLLTVAVIVPVLREHLAVFAEDDPAHWSSRVRKAVRCGEATSTRCQPGRRRSSHSPCPACTPMISDTRATTSQLGAVRGSGI